MTSTDAVPRLAEGRYSLGLLLRGSCVALLLHRRALLTAAALPFVLLLLNQLLLGPLDAAPPAADLDPDLPPVATGIALRDLLAALVKLLAATLFAVSWHRFLLGYEAPRLLPRLGRRHRRYFGCLLLVVLLPLAPLLLVNATAPAGQGAPPGAVGGGVVWLLIGGYLAQRFSLTLPAAAAEVPLTLRDSWRATRGHMLPLFLAPLIGGLLALALAALLFLVLIGPLLDPGRVGGGGDGLRLLAALALGQALLLVEVALAAGILSHAVVRLIPDPAAPHT